MTARREAAVLTAVVQVVFAVHGRSPVITAFDSRGSIFVAMSLVRHGT